MNFTGPGLVSTGECVSEDSDRIFHTERLMVCAVPEINHLQLICQANKKAFYCKHKVEDYNKNHVCL